MRYLPLLFLVGLLSCSHATPGSFWENYKKDILKESESDQGPYGGHRMIYWKSNERSFDPDEVVDFAKENGWELVDTVSLAAYPPRWIKGDVTVYAFKTGWLLINPGDGETNEINGFVVLKDDRTEMEVYHI